MHIRWWHLYCTVCQLLDRDPKGGGDASKITRCAHAWADILKIYSNIRTPHFEEKTPLIFAIRSYSLTRILLESNSFWNFNVFEMSAFLSSIFRTHFLFFFLSNILVLLSLQSRQPNHRKINITKYVAGI